MSLVVLSDLWDAVIMASDFFCVTNKAIPTKPVSDALEILVDIVLS